MQPDFTNPTLYIALGYGASWLAHRIQKRFRSAANQEIVNQFVQQVAENHLPHIYSGLQAIAEALHVELPDPPPIHFTQLNGNGKKK